MSKIIAGFLAIKKAASGGGYVPTYYILGF